jgi:L-asparaginase / beta-aspartyl-peptidase
MREIVIAHGGVDVPMTASYQSTVERAALAGAARLDHGLVDAVEAAVVIMEDDPSFNAGMGSVLNRDGAVELDALIVDGSTGRAGAVAAIKGTDRPISVARRLAETTPYVLLAGDGASQFAIEQGFPVVDCVTPAQQHAWIRMRDSGSLSDIGLNPFTGQAEPAQGSDTVGCVVSNGYATAAGVSTGGLFFKAPGRVGDSAIVGAGAFASPAGAIAGTGLGEAFHELLLCRRVAQLLEANVHPQQAVEEALSLLHYERQGVGGLIALDGRGRIGVAYNGRTFAVSVVIDGLLCPIEPKCINTQTSV